MNVLKKIYDKYNNHNERLIDVIDQIMKDEEISVEDMTNIIKNDPKLLSIYKHECKVFNLIKDEKHNSFNLTSLFI